jgi:uncharacterized protein YijF (DUF1287 family)
MKRAALAAAIFAALLAGLGVYGYATGRLYRGDVREPRSWNGEVDRARVVSEARKLVGIWYDPLQGYLWNAGGRAGLIVCMDVPVIAYRNAGASIRRLLEADYRAHPDRYGTRNGAPGDPYFHRRARNLYTYCKANGRLDPVGPPRPGDVVFLSRAPLGAVSHIAVVSQVRPDGSYSVVEASRDYFYATREVDDFDLSRRGWFVRGFGSVLDR